MKSALGTTPSMGLLAVAGLALTLFGNSPTSVQTSWPPSNLHRLALPSNALSTELTQAQQPYLLHGKQIVARHHVVEGRQFHVLQDPRWEANLRRPWSVVVLHDQDNDGVFELEETVDSGLWSQRGYNDPAVWTLF